MIAISGEYPAPSLSALIPSPSYAKKVITALTNDKLIKTVYKNGVRGYRLASRGKKRLLRGNMERFQSYLMGDVETNRVRTEHTRRLRLHSMAEVYTIMYNAGVEIFQDLKPKLYGNGNQEALPLVDEIPSQTNIGNLNNNTTPTTVNPSNGNPIIQHAPASSHTPKPQPLPTHITAPHFYSSREQKPKETKSNSIRGSRASGTLLTPNQVLAVYNTGSTLIKWPDTEQRYKLELRDDLCWGKFRQQYRTTEVGGILMGTNMEILQRYLETKPKGRQHAPLHFLINSYSPLYYITNDKHGVAQLKLLCTPQAHNALHQMMGMGYLPQNPKSDIEHDAMTKDGNPVLFCCLIDIPRLIRFQNGLSMSGRSGSVICFDFQKEVIGGYLGDRVELKVVNFEKFRQKFFPEG